MYHLPKHCYCILPAMYLWVSYSQNKHIILLNSINQLIMAWTRFFDVHTEPLYTI
jgi:hypothetical protein